MSDHMPAGYRRSVQAPVVRGQLVKNGLRLLGLHATPIRRLGPAGWGSTPGNLTDLMICMPGWKEGQHASAEPMKITNCNCVMYGRQGACCAVEGPCVMMNFS